MSQSKHYTAKDIERYHSGQLSAAEMHALEKAALDDPFLADALEGYNYTSTPENDLSVLQQKLQLRIEKDKKRRGLFFLQNNWMRVAALFILVAGGGWLVYQTFSSNTGTVQSEVATNQSVQKQAETAVPGVVSADSASVFSDAPTNESIVAAPQQQVDRLQRNDVARNGNAQRLQTTPVAPTAAPSEESKFKDQRVTMLAQGQKQTLVDSNAGYFKMNDAFAKKERDAATDSVTNITVVLKPTPMRPDEVVVLNNRSMETAARRQRVVIDTLEPAEGWTSFDDYIANNIKQPEELKTKPVHGAVELTFDVNQHGDPVNITVIKSLCQKCDEEAVRLLKEGPKWKKNKKKGKVTIRF